MIRSSWKHDLSAGTVVGLRAKTVTNTQVYHPEYRCFFIPFGGHLAERIKQLFENTTHGVLVVFRTNVAPILRQILTLYAHKRICN